MRNVTRDNLIEVMEFDHVIRVHPDGLISEPDNVWAPEVTYDGGDVNVSSMVGHDWNLVGGFSGQFKYSGPVMHPSEYIGGKLADHILENPGLYVAVVVSDLTDDESERDETYDAGWAIAHIVDTDEE